MAGGPRPYSGPKKGGLGKRKIPASERAKRMAEKLLYEKDPYDNETRIAKMGRHLLSLYNADSAKDKDTAYKFLVKLLEYADGRPAESVNVSGEIKQKSVLVLPETMKLEDWMAAHGQKEVKPSEPQGKPN